MGKEPIKKNSSLEGGFGPNTSTRGTLQVLSCLLNVCTGGADCAWDCLAAAPGYEFKAGPFMLSNEDLFATYLTKPLSPSACGNRLPVTVLPAAGKGMESCALCPHYRKISLNLQRGSF